MLRQRRGTMLDLRRENRAAVLWSLYFSRPGSRQDLSAATGLSTTSVTNVVRELIDDGIVIEVGSEESDGGRPRMLLDINQNHRYAIGVDVGETRIRVELFDLTMTPRAGWGSLKTMTALSLRDGNRQWRRAAVVGRRYANFGTVPFGRTACETCLCSPL